MRSGMTDSQVADLAVMSKNDLKAAGACVAASRCGAWLTVGFALVLLLALPLDLRGADASIEAAYHRQFQALAADDIEGHVSLALWCRDQQAWDLLLRQCNQILTLDPKHTQARLLLKLAKSKLPSGSGSGTDPQSSTRAGTNTPAKGGKFKLLTDAQIQVLKRTELRLDQPEKITVEFRNNVAERFWTLVEGREGYGKRDRIAFNKLHPAAKAQRMFSHLRAYRRNADEDNPFDDTYSEDIVITNDPLVFRVFKTRVSKPIMAGCASAKCHGGKDAGDFKLFRERVMTDAALYTNFFILHEYEVDGRRLINRDLPDQSLLLVYGFPASSNQTVRHPGDVPPVYKSLRDRKLTAVRAWINMLSPPAPDYGFTLDDLR